MTKKHLLLEQWSKGLAELLAAAGTGTFVPTLLAAVKRLVDFDFVMVFAYRGGEPPLLLGDTLSAAQHRIIASDYAAGPFLLDPFYQLVRSGRRAGCYRLHAVAPDRFRHSEYFRMHYGRTGIGEEIGCFFDPGGGLTGVVSFARWDRSPAMVRGELEILCAIEPALGAACAHHWSNLHGVGTGPVRTLTGEHLRMGPLSAREREIVTMILQGHSTESVALRLDISPGTVKIHRKNIYRKMRVSTQAELFAVFLNAAAHPPQGSSYSQGDMAMRGEIAHVGRQSR
jgi:DNA-binding CsgD family transcriptional regulator